MLLKSEINIKRDFLPFIFNFPFLHIALSRDKCGSKNMTGIPRQNIIIYIYVHLVKNFGNICCFGLFWPILCCIATFPSPLAHEFYIKIILQPEYLVWTTVLIKHTEANTAILDTLFLIHAFFMHFLIQKLF